MTYRAPNHALLPAPPPENNIETNITQVKANTDLLVRNSCGNCGHRFVIWNFGGFLIETRRAA
jgi:hypothetical protein